MPLLDKETKSALWKRIDAATRRARLEAAAFEDDTPERKEARIERAMRDPLYFCRTYLPHYFRSEPAVFHGEWLGKLDQAADSVLQAHQAASNPAVLYETEKHDSVLACPRGFAKTTVISFGGSLYLLVVKRLPFFLVVCDTAAQASEIVEGIADEIEDNALLRSDFGDLMRSRKPSAYGSAVETRDRCKIQALGFDQSFRGIKHRQYRPFMAVLDDPEDDVEVRNDKRREASRNKLTGKLRLALEPWSSIFICQNFIHFDCLSAHIVRNVQAAQKAAAAGQPVTEFRWRKWRAFVYEARLEDGASAWPARFSTAYLDELEEEDPETFALEMLNHAIQRAVQIFVRDNARYFEEPDLADVELLFSVLALDPSKGKTGRSDFSAFILLAAANDGSVYTRLADLQRRSPLKILEDWFCLYLEWQPDICIVETVAFQELLKDVFEEMCASRGLYPPVREYIDKAPKELRIERLERPVNQGVIRFKREQRELLTQLFEYPNAAHDDGPDALEMAWSQVQGLTRGLLRQGQAMIGSRRRDVLRGGAPSPDDGFGWNRFGAGRLGLGKGAW